MGMPVTGAAQGIILAASQKAGQPQALSTGWHNEAIVSELLPRYAYGLLAAKLFCISLNSAAAVTAYAGAAAGTPMIAAYNPVGSGVNLIPVYCSVFNAVAASAAGSATFSLWSGVTATAITAAPTASATPRNMLTGSASGSVASGYTNAALTGAAALNIALPINTYYWATAASAANVTPPPVEIPGIMAAPPGGYLALGGSAALTSATWGGLLVWMELPI